MWMVCRRYELGYKRCDLRALGARAPSVTECAEKVWATAVLVASAIWAGPALGPRLSSLAGLALPRTMRTIGGSPMAITAFFSA